MKHIAVFVWSADPHDYKAENVVKEYKSEKAAEKYAEKLNEVNPVYVVRYYYS